MSGQEPIFSDSDDPKLVAIYEMVHAPEVARVLEELRSRIASTGSGVTLTGNRLTVRWMEGGKLVFVHTIIESVRLPGEDGTEKPCQQEGRQ